MVFGKIGKRPLGYVKFSPPESLHDFSQCGEETCPEKATCMMLIWKPISGTQEHDFSSFSFAKQHHHSYCCGRKLLKVKKKKKNVSMSTCLLNGHL